MNKYFADDTQRRTFIDNLRALADFLEAHPDVPAPRYPGDIHVHTAGTDEQKVAAVVSAALAMGVEPQLESDGHHLKAQVQFGPIAYVVVGISKQSQTDFELRQRLGDEAFARLRDRSLGDAEDGQVVEFAELATDRARLTQAVTA